jgi:hypothetical protein
MNLANENKKQPRGQTERGERRDVESTAQQVV